MSFHSSRAVERDALADRLAEHEQRIGRRDCDARKVGNLWTLMGNATQIQTCPPDEYGNSQLNQFSNASGEKLYNCFIDGCLRNPNYGDPTP